MIDIHGVGKTYGLRPVLRGVTLSIEQGEFVTLFGPNGAGKTTLLRIIATLSKPTAGRVIVGGYDAHKNGDAVRSLLGVVSHKSLLYDDLTADENLRFYARMYQLPKGSRETRITEVLEAVSLQRRANDLVGTFSRGMQQRLSIARAILHQPPVMLLDEPYTGLDQDAAATLDNILRDVAAAGRTVLMTTHNISRGLALTDRALILSRGKIAFESPRSQLDEAGFAETYADVTGMAGIR